MARPFVPVISSTNSGRVVLLLLARNKRMRFVTLNVPSRVNPRSFFRIDDQRIALYLRILRPKPVFLLNRCYQAALQKLRLVSKLRVIQQFEHVVWFGDF